MSRREEADVEEADVVDVGAFEGTVDPAAVDPAAVDPAAVDPAARNVSMEDPPLDGDGDDDAADRNRTPDRANSNSRWWSGTSSRRMTRTGAARPLPPRETVARGVDRRGLRGGTGLGVREDDAEEDVGLET